jgi:hypothetical protein
VGRTYKKRGFAGGVYTTLDWEWIGVTAGLIQLYRKSTLEELTVEKTDLVAGLRLGNRDLLYASFDAYGSSPSLTGGGSLNLGVGGKFHETRLWLGLGQYPERNADSTSMLGVIRLSQGFGPTRVSLAAQFNPDDIPPPDRGIDKEYGLSLSVEYRLP